MAVAMTPRERIIAALKGEMPDQIPFTCYDSMLPVEPHLGRLTELGLAGFARVPPYKVRRQRVPAAFFVVSGDGATARGWSFGGAGIDCGEWRQLCCTSIELPSTMELRRF